MRQAIDCLPVRTREAMLAGISDNDIIVGAYTDRDGRICPMLAAHRAGWAWLRVFRRYDDYSAALAQIESEEKAAAAPHERERVP